MNKLSYLISHRFDSVPRQMTIFFLIPLFFLQKGGNEFIEKNFLGIAFLLLRSKLHPYVSLGFSLALVPFFEGFWKLLLMLPHLSICIGLILFNKFSKTIWYWDMIFLDRRESSFFVETYLFLARRPTEKSRKIMHIIYLYSKYPSIELTIGEDTIDYDIDGIPKRLFFRKQKTKVIQREQIDVCSVCQDSNLIGSKCTFCGQSVCFECLDISTCSIVEEHVVKCQLASCCGTFTEHLFDNPVLDGVVSQILANPETIPLDRDAFDESITFVQKSALTFLFLSLT